MPKFFRWCCFILLVAVCGLGGFILWARSGPTLAPPAIDPVIRLNAAHADVDQACAAAYRRAHEALTAGPSYSTEEREARTPGQPLPEALIAWVEENSEALNHVREATAHEQCWFPLGRNVDGSISLGDVPFSGLSRLLQARAWIAADRRDVGAFAESIELSDRQARHAFDHPVMLWQLRGRGIVSRTQDLVLAPYSWEALTVDDRRVYHERVQHVFAPVPSQQDVILNEIEEMTWHLHTTMPLHSRIFMPPGRLYYEFDRVFSPIVALAGQAIPEQFAGLPALETTIDGLLSAPAPKPSERVGRALVSILVPSTIRDIELHVRTVAHQRGNQTAMAILAHHDAHGTYPVSLDELDDDFTIDPFTGNPFVYHHTEHDFTLYSAGVDRDDDGGRHHAQWGEQKTIGIGTKPPPDGDYVFWPLPEPLPESAPE
jgi:hypothetical protein